MGDLCKCSNGFSVVSYCFFDARYSGVCCLASRGEGALTAFGAALLCSALSGGEVDSWVCRIFLNSLAVSLLGLL